MADRERGIGGSFRLIDLRYCAPRSPDDDCFCGGFFDFAVFGAAGTLMRSIDTRRPPRKR